MIRYYVTDRSQGDVLTYARRAIAAGVDMIQIREKDLPGRQLLELVCQVRDLATGTPTRILVNDRVDIAVAAGVDGVHLPANGLPPARVRPFVKVLGISTHTLNEAVEAEQARSDFIVFGPIFDTPGKTPVGIDVLRDVASRVKIPVLAIGGITPENTQEVLTAGAAGIAGIRLFQR
jgi:thiamine-phosphate diphosphorylase